MSGLYASPHFPPVRVIKPGLEGGSGDARKLFVVGFDPGGTTGWCVMRINYEALRYGGLSGVCLAHPDPELFSWSTGSFSGPTSYHAEQMMALLRGTWMHGEGVWDEGGESDLFIVGIESFTLQVMSTSEELLSPVRVTAAFWALAWRSLFVPVVKHSPSDAKRTFTDHRMRMFNLWGDQVEDHERDATRQAMLVARKACEPGWIRDVAGRMKWLNSDFRL